jgi:hypothetical protein
MSRTKKAARRGKGVPKPAKDVAEGSTPTPDASSLIGMLLSHLLSGMAEESRRESTYITRTIEFRTRYEVPGKGFISRTHKPGS